MYFRQRTRARAICFVERDELIFSLALKDEFPDIQFVAKHSEAMGGGRPIVNIAVSDSDVVDVELGAGPWHPHFRVLRSRWGWGWPWIAPERWGWDPPTLGEGLVGTSYRVGDEQTRLFGVRVWRLLGKVATNKVKGGTPATNAFYGGDRRLMSESKGGNIWCGHHALAWCQAGGSRRMLTGCFRPCDDWEVPTNAWYQNLMRRATETEGWNARTLEPPDAEIPD